MSKYTLIATLGASHKILAKYHKAAKEQVFQVNLLAADDKSGYGIYRALLDLSKLGIVPSTVGIEVLNLAILVQIADGRLNRIQTSQDAWSREIKIMLPVKDLKLWAKTEKILTDTLNFLTGDFWVVEFYEDKTEYKLPEIRKEEFPPLDNVCLFSGGLDSTIGAIDLLQNGNRSLFVSYAGGEGAVSGPQEQVFHEITEHYKSSIVPQRLRLQSLRYPKFKDIGRENSTRGRSFLFFALAIFAGSGFKKQFKLFIPENGLIALNVPLDSTRLGSLSTRTTHPYYISKWNEFITTLGINGVISNPYWNKTKGEMAANCKNSKLLKAIYKKTVSCAHPSQGRYTGHSGKHCRHCVPCIIRQAALNFAWGKGKDKTDYRSKGLSSQKWDSMKAEGRQIRAFQLAASRVITKPDISKLLIYKQGSLLGEAKNLDQLAQVYLRGMKEVNMLLKNVQTYSSK